MLGSGGKVASGAASAIACRIAWDGIGCGGAASSSSPVSE
jgi:hypothetical protein